MRLPSFSIQAHHNWRIFCNGDKVMYHASPKQNVQKYQKEETLF